MSIISSLGGGSGLDTTKMIEDLANASRQPKLDLLTKRADTVKAKISAVAQARSDLETFTNSLGDLVAGGTLQSQPTVSNSAVLGATAQTGARVGDLSGEIEVTQLARPQTVYSDYVADPSASLGGGSLTLTVGGRPTQVVVDAAHDSLSGLAAAINASGAGVSATIRTDANGSRLVLRGASGSLNGFTLASTDAGLQAYTFGSGTGLTLGQGAQDAKFTLDGVAYVRSQNIISDAVPGVTLTLKKAAPGEQVSLSAERPTQVLRQTVQDFVTVYNTLRKDLTAARTATGSDAALRALEQQLGGLLTAPCASGGSVRTMADLGVSTTRDGTLTINSATLELALKNHPDEVEAIFSPTRDETHTTSTDPGIGSVLKALNDNATKSGGPLESLRQRLETESSGVAKDKERMETREAAYRTRLQQQFGGLDSRISALKATQSYLEQQVKVWTNGSGN